MIWNEIWVMSIPVLHPCRNHNLYFGPFCDNPIFFFLLLVISEEIFDFYHFLLFNPVSPWNLKYFNAVRTEIYLTWFPLGTESNYFWYFLVIKDHCFWILTKMLITCYVLQCWVSNLMCKSDILWILLYLPKIHKLKLWYLGRH